VRELEHLQNQVAPEPLVKIPAQLRRKLGGQIEGTFERFDEKPVAAGSIAQIHRAVARKGSQAAAKIRRPGIVATIRAEFEILADLAGVLKSAPYECFSVILIKTMKEFGLFSGYPIGMEQKKSENPKGSRNSAVTWMQILPAVSAYVRSTILNYHDSEDIIQNIAVIFAEKYDRLDPSRKVLPWILRIARYEVVNYFRSRGQEQIIFDEKVLQRIERAYHVIHDESEGIKKALHTCIESLNDRPRHVLMLRYFREMEIRDISRRLGLSSNAVYIMLCRVREALAKCVQKKTGVLWKVT